MENTEIYIPKTHYRYPSATSEHMITVEHRYDPVLDERYTYRDKSKWFMFRRFWFRILLDAVVLPIARLRYDFRVEGKDNIRNNADILSNGYVTVSNHVFMWDYLLVQAGLWPVKTETPMWKKNNEGPLAPLMRLAGAIPVPDSKSGKASFFAALDEAIDEHQTVHFSAEGSMWFYCVPIRPFKKGAFVLAQKHGVPIVPMVFTYREPMGAYRLLKRDEPNVTLHIGAPQFADPSLDAEEAAGELAERVRGMMIRMAGIADESANDELLAQYPRCAEGETVLY